MHRRVREDEIVAGKWDVAVVGAGNAAFCAPQVWIAHSPRTQHHWVWQ
jgi:hypothetical protein